MQEKVESFDMFLALSYIKSWKIVPQDFVILKVTSLDTQKVKGWLFKNIPEKHAHR